MNNPCSVQQATLECVTQKAPSDYTTGLGREESMDQFETYVGGNPIGLNLLDRYIPITFYTLDGEEVIVTPKKQDACGGYLYPENISKPQDYRLDTWEYYLGRYDVTGTDYPEPDPRDIKQRPCYTSTKIFRTNNVLLASDKCGEGWKSLCIPPKNPDDAPKEKTASFTPFTLMGAPRVVTNVNKPCTTCGKEE